MNWTKLYTNEKNKKITGKFIKHIQIGHLKIKYESLKLQTKQTEHSLPLSRNHKIPQPDKKKFQEENYWPISLINNMQKFSKILSNKIQQSIQITIYHGQVEFTPGIHMLT